MIVFLIAVLVIVVGLVVAGITLRVTGSADAPTSTSPFEPLPRGEITADDVGNLRFDQTLRGYRMGQVDDVLDRLREELTARDEQIRRLQGKH